MVELLVLSRQGGAYSSAVFPNDPMTNPSLTLRITKWSWKYQDAELAVDVPNTTDNSPPMTIAGGFKRTTIGVDVEGIIDKMPNEYSENVYTKIKALWNIAELGDPSVVYALWRGSYLFGYSPGSISQIKITDLKIVEDSIVSEPAQNISGSASTPKRATFTFSIRKMARSS